MFGRLTFQLSALMAAAALATAAASMLLVTGSSQRALEQSFQQRWGVTVVARDLNNRVSTLVNTPRRPVRMNDLAPAHEPVALDLIGQAFSVYPKGFVSRMLKTVALASHIEVWDQDAGGLYHDRLIAVNFDGVGDKVTRGFNIDTVNHELSSIVRREVTFDITAWEKAKPPGFNYLDTEGHKKILKDAGSVEGDPALHKAGFISRYGQTLLDNDWNTYAERVFGHGPEFASLLQAEPALRPKTRILMDVYQSLDPRFVSYFMKSGLLKAAS